MSCVRGVRGAITVGSNTAGEILSATTELLEKIQKDNQLATADVVSAIFTVTHDLDAAFPATAARAIGWNTVPLLCMQEIPVPGSVPRCIRILLHVNTDKTQKEMKPVYLREAVTLRPDHAGDQQ